MIIMIARETCVGLDGDNDNDHDHENDLDNDNDRQENLHWPSPSQLPSS